jgi:hypothetical protein
MIIFVSTTGDDSIGDGSSGSPYLTVSKAIQEASPGDEISIGSGTYAENIIINKSLSIYSQTGVPSDVILTSAVRTVLVAHSTNDVVVRDITITATSTTQEAVSISIQRDFSVNPSGLPVISTLCENVLIQNCIINFVNVGMAIHAKDSVVKKCTFNQSGVVSRYNLFLIYTIDNLSILENTHSTAVSPIRHAFWLTNTGAGEYRRNTLIIKQNTISVGTVNPGHFIFHELTNLHPSGDKFRYDVQGNTFNTTQASTGGFFILFPVNTTNLQNILSTENTSVIANNTVINPYRGWLYVELATATPSPMGDTYFNIYDNELTGDLVQRPNSYDVDGEQIVLLSTTPASTDGWVDIYVGSVKEVTLPTTTNESDALDILRDTLLRTYPGETINISLTLFSINTEDDPVVIVPIVHQSSDPLTDTDSQDLRVTVTNPNPDFRYLFLVLDTPYKESDTLTFVLKVFNNVTNELVTTDINADLEIVLGGSFAGRTFKLLKYVHPEYQSIGDLVETSTPGTYTFILNTSSLYSLQEDNGNGQVTTGTDWAWLWAAIITLAILLLISLRFIRRERQGNLLPKNS